ncbi:MAG: hypothetical protein F4Y96_05395 [Chloroflexi bacterium]|nr:hypothetical protein [Chloroflexota bacterium]
MSTADDQARGLMVGIAAGNLLGITVEGRTKDDIRHRFPNGMRDIAAKPGSPDDDDLAQSLIIAEAAEEGPLDVEDLGHRFWEWGEVNGLGMGNLTSQVLALFGGGPPRRLGWGTIDDVRQPRGLAIEDASRKAWGRKSAGNGALMRCTPIAIRWRDDAVALARNSVVSAVPTHWDTRCGWSCAVLNIGIAAALRGETMDADALIAAAEEAVLASLPELSQYEYEAGMPHSVRIAVAQAASLEIDEIEFDGWNLGFTLLALRAGLISLWRAPDFEQGLRAVVEAGGDTDTNGAVAGAVLGARFGIDAIPQRWRDRIAELREGRTPLEECADMLTAARG